jgi:hypothetical protein
MAAEEAGVHANHAAFPVSAISPPSSVPLGSVTFSV